MVSRVVSLMVALIFLSGCGPEKITETKEQTEQRAVEMEAAKNRRGGGAPRMTEKIAPKQWDQSKPKIAELLEKRKQMVQRFPVPWTPGLTLEQATSAAKERLASSKAAAPKKEDQKALEMLEQAKKALETNDLIYTTNEIIKLESKQLRIERAGIDPSIEGDDERSDKMYFKSEEAKKEKLANCNASLKSLNEFKNQLEEIENQLIAASK